jgi:ABC-type branched-subunit amino acid transport system ATPase component
MVVRPLLKVEGIKSGYGKKEILHGVTLHVGAGETVCLIGPNGAGKSTVLLTILGFLNATEGRILFRNEEINGIEPHHAIRLGIGFCPQRRNIFPEMTVAEHLDLAGWTIGSSSRKQEGRERTYHMFPLLRQRARQKAQTLSGGERQMLTLGMAMMTNPSLILLDEPTIGLAPMIVEHVFQSLDQIGCNGVSILVVEQNAAKALAHSQRAYVLDMGQNRHEGESARLLADPNVRRMYLGA